METTDNFNYIDLFVDMVLLIKSDYVHCVKFSFSTKHTNKGKKSKQLLIEFSKL